MPNSENSLAALEAQVAMMRQTLNELVSLQRGQSELNHSLQQAIALMQQAHNDTVKKTTADSARLDALVALREQVRGGWFALTVLLMILSAASAALGAWLKTKMSAH